MKLPKDFNVLAHDLKDKIKCFDKLRYSFHLSLFSLEKYSNKAISWKSQQNYNQIVAKRLALYHY